MMSEQAELLKQGIAISGGDYRHTWVNLQTNDVKPQMIEEATKNARAAAEKFAKDSDSSLGKIRNASQGQFSISDRDANTLYIKNIRVVTTVNYYLKTIGESIRNLSMRETLFQRLQREKFEGRWLSLLHCRTLSHQFGLSEVDVTAVVVTDYRLYRHGLFLYVTYVPPAHAWQKYIELYVGGTNQINVNQEVVFIA